MAEKCICCGKKIGLLNGSHLNEQVCDSCYFPISSYLKAIKEENDVAIIENNYNQLINKLQSSAYSEAGKEYILKLASKFIKDNKSTTQKTIRNKQIRDGFLITTSNKFDKYEIVKYYGIASGNTVIGTGFLSESRAAIDDVFGTENDSFSNKLEQARNGSMQKMINNAIIQGGNALIGVSFDYITFSSNMIGVVANGTVVEIVKESFENINN